MDQCCKASELFHLIHIYRQERLPLKVAARVQIPLGVPMKKVPLVVVVLYLAACGDGDSSSDLPVDADFVAPTGVAV